ncbi:MAG: hypothetical protein ACRCY3_11840 [Sphingorhabdus sp.]
MPSYESVIGLIQKKFDEIGLDRNSYTLGPDYKDDSFCLYKDGGDWCVGWNERGKKWPQAKFGGDLEAAEYLIFLLKKDGPDSGFPKIDWTAYASLP